MRLPSDSEVIRRPLREPGVVEHQFGTRTSIVQLKTDDRVDARVPRILAPCLYQALARNHFDVSSHNHPAEERKRAPEFLTDLGRGSGNAERRDFVELIGIGQRTID